MKRTLKKLLAPTKDFRQRLRDLVAGGTLVGLGLSTTAVAAKATAPTEGQASNDFTVVDRATKAKKLILNLPDGTAYRMLRHGSHSSHSSHSSHASHYSGSSGVVRSPAPAAPRPAPVAPSQTLVSPPLTAESAVADPGFLGVVETVNRQSRTFLLKPVGAEKVAFSYKDDTTFSWTAGASTKLGDSLDAHDGELPFKVGDKLRVWWTPQPGKKNMATSITRVP
jgi:hypothetical protein